MKKIKYIAIVDDDDIYTYITEKKINDTNLVEQIQKFSNGQEAYDFLSKNTNNSDSLPDIMFLDLSMPIMDGWQFLEEYQKIYKELAKEIAIYICSTSISPNDLLRAKSISKVNDYIVKPLSKDKVVELINDLR